MLAEVITEGRHRSASCCRSYERQYWYSHLQTNASGDTRAHLYGTVPKLFRVFVFHGGRQGLHADSHLRFIYVA